MAEYISSRQQPGQIAARERIESCQLKQYDISISTCEFGFTAEREVGRKIDKTAYADALLACLLYTCKIKGVKFR